MAIELNETIEYALGKTKSEEERNNVDLYLRSQQTILRFYTKKNNVAASILSTYLRQLIEDVPNWRAVNGCMDSMRWDKMSAFTYAICTALVSFVTWLIFTVVPYLKYIPLVGVFVLVVVIQQTPGWIQAGVSLSRWLFKYRCKSKTVDVLTLTTPELKGIHGCTQEQRILCAQVATDVLQRLAFYNLFLNIPSKHITVHKMLLESFLASTSTHNVDERLQKLIFTSSSGELRLDAKLPSHYHKSDTFGIFRHPIPKGGIAVLRAPQDRKNGFLRDQITLPVTPPESDTKLVIVRNRTGKGGTPWAKSGEAGSAAWSGMGTEAHAALKNGEGGFGTAHGSMSGMHQFCIHNDTSIWWSNVYFFGKGPGKYGREGTLKLLYSMRELALGWAVKNKVSQPLFFFHEYPNNSLPSLHMHMIDMDKRVDVAYDHYAPSNLELEIVIARLEGNTDETKEE